MNAFYCLTKNISGQTGFPPFAAAVSRWWAAASIAVSALEPSVDTECYIMYQDKNTLTLGNPLSGSWGPHPHPRDSGGHSENR